jgi:hypothetical protein
VKRELTVAAILWVTAIWVFKPTPADVRAGIYLARQALQARRAARREANRWAP